MKTKHAILVGIFVGASVFPEGYGVTFEDVVFWVGSGTKRAALVVDWNDGVFPESFVWGYRWDGVATGLEMLQAVVESDSRLFAHVSEPGPFGTAVYGIGYDQNGNGSFGVTPGLEFNAGGWSIGVPDDHRRAGEDGDRWAEGWNLGFWGYYVKEPGAEEWTVALTGPSDRILADGAWDGYSFAPGFRFSEPSGAAPAPVPEPEVYALMCVGVLVLLGKTMGRFNAGTTAGRPTRGWSDRARLS
ncbi:MAG: hypothetical protein N3G20_02955 [Verrucomicrobiae bacterium]|nr:hypothetical protein [Verrucomicrobiae bacterium]